jgi:hypothetical protein
VTEIILVRGTRHEVHECLTCGCIIVASEKLLDHMREIGGFYHCQNGHKQGWTLGGSEITRLRLERDKLKQEQAQLNDRIATELSQREKVERTLDRHKKRSKAGVCPCCTRSFANMARHMKAQHPDYNVIQLKKA